MKYLGDYITDDQKAQIKALESDALATVDGSVERDVINLKIKVLVLEAQMAFIEHEAEHDDL